MSSRCQQWEGVMATICNASVTQCDDKEMVSERFSTDYNELPPSNFANVCTRATLPSRQSPPGSGFCNAQPVIPSSGSHTAQAEGRSPTAGGKPGEERLQEFLTRFQHMESRQACSNEALEQISTLLEVTVDKFGTLNETLHQMKTDIGQLHTNLSSLETKVSQTSVPYTAHPAARPVSSELLGEELLGHHRGKEETGLESSEGIGETMESSHLSCHSEPTCASTSLDSDEQSDHTSPVVSKLSGKDSRQLFKEGGQQRGDALVSLISVALKHPDLSGASLLRQWQLQQTKVKSQRDLNVDLVANKSILAMQNQQFVALVRVAMHRAPLEGRDILCQFETELKQEKRAGRGSNASASLQQLGDQGDVEGGLRSFGIQPSLCHQQGVVSLVHVALKHPDVNGFSLLQLWKRERVNIKSQRQLNLNCIEKKMEIQQQNRQFVALVYAALFHPDLEGAELLKQWERLKVAATEPDSPLGCVNPNTFWSRSRSWSSPSPRPSVTISFDPQKQERLVSLVRLVVDNPELNSAQLCELWRHNSNPDACNGAAFTGASSRTKGRLMYLGAICSALCAPLGLPGLNLTCKSP